MGRFLIPCCCICGKSPMEWNNKKWHDDGGLQDFCPEHSDKELEPYVNSQFEIKERVDFIKQMD
jgi:hypothetical protein